MHLKLNIKGGTVSLTNHIWCFWKIPEEITVSPSLWGECVTFRDPTGRARGRFALFGVMVRNVGMFEGSQFTVYLGDRLVWTGCFGRPGGKVEFWLLMRISLFWRTYRCV